MDFENHIRRGSVRKLRQHFEQNNSINDYKRKDDLIVNKNENKPKIQTKLADNKAIINNNFLNNKPLSNDKKSDDFKRKNNSNEQLFKNKSEVKQQLETKLKENKLLNKNRFVDKNKPLISVKNLNDFKRKNNSNDKLINNKTEDKLKTETNLSENSFTENNESLSNEKSFSSIVNSRKETFEPNISQLKTRFSELPPPKPPRTFEHDLYMKTKFKTNNNSIEQNIDDLYSKPNKTNKLNKTRIRSKSDSQVLDKNKSVESIEEHIYDDCIHKTNFDKRVKNKIEFFRHLSCLKLK